MWSTCRFQASQGSESLAQCIFSRGAESLYLMASSCCVCTKKSLLKPGWPMSCAAAAINNVYLRAASKL